MTEDTSVKNADFNAADKPNESKIEKPEINDYKMPVRKKTRGFIKKIFSITALICIGFYDMLLIVLKMTNENFYTIGTDEILLFAAIANLLIAPFAALCLIVNSRKNKAANSIEQYDDETNEEVKITAQVSEEDLLNISDEAKTLDNEAATVVNTQSGQNLVSLSISEAQTRFTQIHTNLSNFLSKEGVRNASDCAADLLSAMAAGKIIGLKTQGFEQDEQFIESLIQFFSARKTYLEDMLLVKNPAAFDRSQIVFCTVTCEQLLGSKVQQFILDHNKYAHRKNSSYLKDIYLKNLFENIWFLVTLPEKGFSEQVQLEIAKRMTVIEFEHSLQDTKSPQSSAEDAKLNIDFSLNYSVISCMFYMLENIKFLDEKHWQKLDLLEKYMVNNSYGPFKNSIWRSLEKYICAQLVCRRKEEQALDCAAVYVLIPSLINVITDTNFNEPQFLAELKKTLGEQSLTAVIRMINYIKQA